MPEPVSWSVPTAQSTPEIVGRRSSHFTRVPLLLAEVLRVPCRLTTIADMRTLDPMLYAGNPALKLPILRDGSDVVFGALNICRALAARASATRAVHVVWPEDLHDTLSRNAQELIWHCMASQVQLVMGTLICKLPAESIFFVKTRKSMEGSLEWLDRHLDRIISILPPQREISILEVTLLCLVEHLSFRSTVPLAAYPSLNDFVVQLGTLEAAGATAYR